MRFVHATSHNPDAFLDALSPTLGYADPVLFAAGARRCWDFRCGVRPLQEVRGLALVLALECTAVLGRLGVCLVLL